MRLEARPHGRPGIRPCGTRNTQESQPHSRPRSSGGESTDRRGQRRQEPAASSSGILLSRLPSLIFWSSPQRSILRTGAILPALICLIGASSSSLTSPLERHCAAAPPIHPSFLSPRCSQLPFSSAASAGAGAAGRLGCEALHTSRRGRASPGLMRLRGGMESLQDESEFGELLADLDEEVRVRVYSVGLKFRV